MTHSHPTTRPIEESLANLVYDILVEVCRANETTRSQFVMWAVSNDELRGTQFRFCGMFGMAGKLWIAWDGIRVSGPNHQELAKLGVAGHEQVNAVVEANCQITNLVTETEII